MSITSRPYRLLSDHMAVYDFMTEIYERDWRNGVAAPFLEYALSSDWMDKSLVHRNRLWFDGGRIVAFVFYENPVTDVYFSLRPGYEFLADEMVEYGHTMESYLGGQIAAGFVITGYLENQTEDITELYFITRSEKR